MLDSAITELYVLYQAYFGEGDVGCFKSRHEICPKFYTTGFSGIFFTSSISPNFSNSCDKSTKKWVKMEKFTPLAKNFHCHWQWRQGKISPLYKSIASHLKNRRRKKHTLWISCMWFLFFLIQDQLCVYCLSFKCLCIFLWFSNLSDMWHLEKFRLQRNCYGLYSSLTQFSRIFSHLHICLSTQDCLARRNSRT